MHILNDISLPLIPVHLLREPHLLFFCRFAPAVHLYIMCKTFSPLRRRAQCSLPFFLIAQSQAFFFNVLAQFEDAFNQGLRTGRAAGDIDIDRDNRIDAPLR